ncbi:uncharacterized protein LOC127788470 isoform X2 [Diospyros lotus]|uniref:uncharacterized protein LOC127788470 isoform X2 n=1 Tax=Diospyros lotus TaxID=55363 RepID=UPI00224F5851|nr:uncharacterized protein LOC127788470 isoform X2 [Diospyros lotus]
MAYRRRQGITRSATFKEEITRYPTSSPDDDHRYSSSSSSSSLAAQAIRASAAHRDSSLSSAYDGDSASLSSHNRTHSFKDLPTQEYASLTNSNENKGFWGVLAQKAKAILEDDEVSQQLQSPNRTRLQMHENSADNQFHQPYQSLESSKKMENPRIRRGLDALTSSLNHIGDTIGNALEEGRTIVENKTQDIIHETRKLQIRRKGSSTEEQNQVSGVYNPWPQPSTQSTQPQMQTNKETQLKASRDIRLQLETLLAEKARLAHENSVYARENRFLREIVEYHQLTMQDVVYIDEGIEEVTEVYPIPAVSRTLSVSPPSITPPRSPCQMFPSTAASLKEAISIHVQPQATADVTQIETPTGDVPQIETPTSCSSEENVPQTEALRTSNGPISQDAKIQSNAAS